MLRVRLTSFASYEDDDIYDLEEGDDTADIFEADEEDEGMYDNDYEGIADDLPVIELDEGYDA